MRAVNRPLALLVSFATIVGTVVLIVEVIAYRIGAHTVVLDWPGLYRWGQRTTWESGQARAAAAGLIILGAILLAIQLKPRRPDRLPVFSEDVGTDAAVTRSGVIATIRDAVADIDGIVDVGVNVRPHRIRIRAQVRPTDPAAKAVLLSAVRRVAQDQLTALQLNRVPTLSVRVATREH